MQSGDDTVGGIYFLPNEIMHEIILYLNARDAISLSLTCRGIYHGILSQYNTELWYRLTPTYYGLMPGFSEDWYWPKNAWLPVTGDSEIHGTAPVAMPWPNDPEQDLRMCVPKSFKVMVVRELDKSERDLIEYSRKFLMEVDTCEVRWFKQQIARGGGGCEGIRWQDLSHCVQKYRTILWHDHSESDEPAAAGENHGVRLIPNFKRILLDCMLGRTENGCQWCLDWDERTVELFADYCEALDMRICRACLTSNIIPYQALHDVPIYTWALPAITHYGSSPITYVDETGQNFPLRGYWKPHLETLLREAYRKALGRDHWITLDDVLDEKFKGPFQIEPHLGLRYSGLPSDWPWYLQKATGSKRSLLPRVYQENHFPFYPRITNKHLCFKTRDHLRKEAHDDDDDSEITHQNTTPQDHLYPHLTMKYETSPEEIHRFFAFPTGVNPRRSRRLMRDWIRTRQQATLNIVPGEGTNLET